MSDSFEEMRMGICQNQNHDSAVSTGLNLSNESSAPEDNDSVDWRVIRRPNRTSSQYENVGCGVNPEPHRSATATSDTTYSWTCHLPLRLRTAPPKYSTKVFLGGIPWNLNEARLHEAFKHYDLKRVEWPAPKKGRHRYKAGHAYLLFESEESVKRLLQSCTHDATTNEWFFRVSSRRNRHTMVQVIPWDTNDSSYTPLPLAPLDINKTIFVGGLHGKLTAEDLFQVMNDTFRTVVRVDIDTDKRNYPIGSGRVTFGSLISYLTAVKVAFLEINTQKFSKKVQIDPYLKNTATCSMCQFQPGSYFCREFPDCFQYYCYQCWDSRHSKEDLRHHRPVMKNKHARFQS